MLLTPSVIAKEAILVLQNNMVLAGLVHRDYSDEFAKVGDTVTVRKPATFVSKEYNGSTIDIQEANETSVSVKMDKLIDVSFAVSSKDLSLTIVDFAAQFIEPAMRAHAQKLDELIASLYVDIPNYALVSGTPAIADFAAVRTIMNNKKVPFDNRALVLDPITEAKYVVLDSILAADKSGSTEALRAASMGKILGLNTFMDQNIAAHVYGTATAATAAGTKDAASFALTAVSAATGTFKAGDVVTVDGNQYTVTADVAAIAGACTLSVSPAVVATCSAKAVTFNTLKAQNIAFHKNAFALVTRPLATPMGAAKAETISFNGISCRVVYDYNMNTKTDTISIDFLAGVKTLDKDLAVRFLG